MSYWQIQAFYWYTWIKTPTTKVAANQNYPFNILNLSAIEIAVGIFYRVTCVQTSAMFCPWRRSGVGHKNLIVFNLAQIGDNLYTWSK